MDIFKDWKDENGLTDKGLKGVTTLGNIANVGLQALAQGNTSIVGNLADTIGGFIPGPWGMGIKAAGNLINAAFGSNINDAAVDAYESDIKGLQNSQYSALDYNNLLAQRQAFNNVSINKEDLGTQGWFGTKLDDTYNTLMEDLQTAKQRNTLAFNTQAAKINDSAFNASVNNMLEYGGSLYDLTGNWNNGLTFINAGGTHEANPFEGVQIGVDPQGVPNLVEEGEIIYNDYVFSNKLKPSKKQLEDNGLNKKYEGWTFAKIVEDIQKESADNPIDFISQNTLKDMMNILITMQESVREKKASNTFAYGGPKGNMFEGNGDKSNFKFQGLRRLEGKPTIDLLVKPKLKILDTPTIPTLKPSTITGRETLDAIANLKTHNPKRYVREYLSSITPATSEDFNWQSLGRYAPVFASSASLLNNIFQKPDYSNANRIEQAARNIPGGTFTPLEDYVNIEPLDRNYYLNPILSTSRSTARTIQNQGLNAGQTIAGLLSNQHNTNIGIGNALMQIDQENMNRRLQEAQFNRGTNQANAQMGLQALAMDQRRAQNILNATAQASQIRSNLDAMRAQAISSDLSGLVENLSGIGTEEEYKSWLQGLIDSGAIKDYLKGKKKNGGRLLTKKRR